VVFVDHPMVWNSKDFLGYLTSIDRSQWPAAVHQVDSHLGGNGNGQALFTQWKPEDLAECSDLVTELHRTLNPANANAPLDEYLTKRWADMAIRKTLPC